MDWPVIEAPRLRLRGWLDSDRDVFAAMNADPLVMRYFPSVLAPEESDAMLVRNQDHFARHGFGFWATELRDSEAFAGFVGLGVPSFDAHFTPCVEIGWRLAACFWNRGLATEGAAALLGFAREALRLQDVVAFTAVPNQPSRRVMEKIGMTYDAAGDFDHPRLAQNHPLRRHVLYRKRLDR